MTEWKECGSCVTDDPQDKTWISEPTTELAVVLANICGRCDVLDECADDAIEFEPTGVFQAGHWRE